jgi:hypothetical protein
MVDPFVICFILYNRKMEYKGNDLQPLRKNLWNRKDLKTSFETLQRKNCRSKRNRSRS